MLALVSKSTTTRKNAFSVHCAHSTDKVLTTNVKHGGPICVKLNRMLCVSTATKLLADGITYRFLKNFLTTYSHNFTIYAE